MLVLLRKNSCNPLKKLLPSILLLVDIVQSDWVEIPQVSTFPKVNVPKRIFTTTPTEEQITFATTTTASSFASFLEIPEVIQNGSNNSKKSPQKILTENVHLHTKNQNQKGGTRPSRSKVTQNGKERFSNKPRTKIETLDEFRRRADYDEPEEIENMPREDEKMGYSFSGFIPLINTIQSTLIRKSHNNFKGKINLLEDLRENLIYNLKQTMCNLWGPKEADERVARDYKEDHHIDFPSNEGALMTIGFLTFAVFLIKLVLQLLSSFRNNNSTTTVITRRQRSIEFQDETLNILKLMEEYKFQ